MPGTMASVAEDQASNKPMATVDLGPVDLVLNVWEANGIFFQVLGRFLLIELLS